MPYTNSKNSTAASNHSAHLSYHRLKGLVELCFFLCVCVLQPVCKNLILQPEHFHLLSQVSEQSYTTVLYAPHSLHTRTKRS